MPVRRTVNGETREWNGTAWMPIPNPSEAVAMHHPGEFETPGEAFVSELGRTGKEAAIGLARSPLDLVKNTLGMVAHPIDTISGTAHAIAHPVETVKAFGDNPREAGSVLGQLLLGKVGAPEIPGVVDAAPEVIGKGVGAVGRGLEAAGTSRPARLMNYAGAGALAYGGNPIKGAMMLAGPKLAEMAGKGLQKLEPSIAGLKRAAVEAPKPNTLVSGLELTPEALARNVEATNMRDVEGFSHTQAGKLSGIPGAGKTKVTDIPTGEYAISSKYERPFPNLEPAGSPEPAEEVGRAVSEPPSMEGLKEAAAPRNLVLAAPQEEAPPPFDYQGERVDVGQPLAVGGTELTNTPEGWTPSGAAPYHPTTDINWNTVEQMANDPNILAAKKLLEARGISFGGDRTVGNTVPSAMR